MEFDDPDDHNETCVGSAAYILLKIWDSSSSPKKKKEWYCKSDLHPHHDKYRDCEQRKTWQKNWTNLPEPSGRKPRHQYPSARTRIMEGRDNHHWLIRKSAICDIRWKHKRSRCRRSTCEPTPSSTCKPPKNLSKRVGPLEAEWRR